MTEISQAGTKIASGSDDLNIIVWEWERGRYVLTMFSYLMGSLKSLEILMHLKRTGQCWQDFIRKA